MLMYFKTIIHDSEQKALSYIWLISYKNGISGVYKMVKKAYIRAYKSQICKILLKSSRELILSRTVKCCSLQRISYRI